MEAADEDERGGKNREAVLGHAEVEVEMEVDAGAGAGLEEAREEGEIEREGKQPVEEEDAAYGDEDAIKREEDRAADWKAGKTQKQLLQQQRTPRSARSRASWRGKGGIGREGFPQIPWKLQHHKLSIFNKPGIYGGAIMLCNGDTKLKSFQQKCFFLPPYAATFIRKIRAGMLLFVFQREERKLCGVFEATSDGAMNMIPNASPSSRKFLPAQVHFRRVWFCKPLIEAEFSDAIAGLQPQMSFFGISYQQVLNLVHLFSSKRIGLQPYQKPKSKVIRDYNIALAHAGLGSSLHTHSNDHPSRSSSMFCNNRISLPRSPFMYGRDNGKHVAYPLHPQLRSVIVKEPDITEECLELDADFIPLELDDPDDYKPDSDAVLFDTLGTVSLYSALAKSISYKDQDPKPFKGKHNEDNGHPSPVLNQSFVSVSQTCQNSAIARFMRERRSSMQGKGCKREAVLQFDEHEHPDLSSPRSCTIAKKLCFSVGGDEISVTSDKPLHRPALAELEQNREAAIQKTKQEVGCSVQDIQSKGIEDSAKRSKLMSLSFAERLANLHLRGCSRNSQPPVTQSSIKLIRTLLTDEE